MKADTKSFSGPILLFRSLILLVATLLVAAALLPDAAAQGLLDDEDVKQPAPKTGGGLLDDEDVKKPAPAGGGLLDDADVPKKPAGGLLDDEDVPKKPGGGLLDDTGDAKQPKKPDPKEEPKDDPKEDPHAKIFADDRFPSASKCATCHQQIYDEWRVSNHAYASISPMFHKFEQKINDLSQGTIGYFCMRCHATISKTLKEPREMPLWARTQV